MEVRRGVRGGGRGAGPRWAGQEEDITCAGAVAHAHIDASESGEGQKLDGCAAKGRPRTGGGGPG